MSFRWWKGKPVRDALLLAQFAALLGYASYLHLTSNPGASFASVWDKALHLGCWLVLAVSMQLALPGIRSWRGFHRDTNLNHLAGAALCLLAYSALLEWGQTFSPKRHFSLGDIAANAIGIAAGVACSYAARRAMRIKKP